MMVFHQQNIIQLSKVLLGRRKEVQRWFPTIFIRIYRDLLVIWSVKYDWIYTLTLWWNIWKNRVRFLDDYILGDPCFEFIFWPKAVYEGSWLKSTCDGLKNKLNSLFIDTFSAGSDATNPEYLMYVRCQTKLQERVVNHMINSEDGPDIHDSDHRKPNWRTRFLWGPPDKVVGHERSPAMISTYVLNDELSRSHAGSASFVIGSIDHLDEGD